MASLMSLSILLPSRIYAEETGVSRIIAETREGSFGLLPHRLDCAMALPAGILTYETETGGERYVAIDDGLLIKAGVAVFVAVRRARAGAVLSDLRDAVEEEFAAIDEREQTVRSVLAKLEAGFLHRLVVLQHD